MENEKKYTQVNNPTQINIGATENSLQTAGRKVKEISEDPSDIIDSTLSFINNFWKGVFKGIFLFIRYATIPFIICLFLGVTTLALYNGAALSHTYSTLYAMCEWFFGSALYYLILKLIPLFIIFGFFSLYIYLTIRGVSNRVFKDNPERASQFTKAAATTAVLMALRGVFSVEDTNKN